MNLDQDVINAKNNKIRIDELIRDYKPMIASELSKVSKKHVDQENDELMTIGMMAFYEAINAYDEGRGHFLSLAKTIIHNRAIDYFRQQASKEILVLQQNDHESQDEINKAMDSFDRQVLVREKAQVIGDFQVELGKWGISLDSLVKESPKNVKIRQLYKDMSRYIRGNPSVYKEMCLKQQLPNQLLMKVFSVTEKKVKRGRHYIIACLILQDEAYNLINDYVK